MNPDPKRQPSPLQRLWQKLRGTKAQPAKSTRLAAQPVKKPVSSLEPLEGRIAPASLINPTTLIYKDVDGDIVTVKFSKSLFTQPTGALDLARANEVFKFDAGTVTGGPFDATTATAQQLQLIDLTKVSISISNSPVNGSALSIVSVPRVVVVNDVPTSGDGFVDIGYIKSTGIALGAVTVDGDLGQIDAGKSSAAVGLSALKVKSLGARGLATQAAGGSLESNIIGRLGSLTVADDVKDASVRAVSGGSSIGSIGNVTIGGSLFGTAAVAAASNNTGLIEAANSIGVVKIGLDAADGVFGGGGVNSGAIRAGGKITSVTISGDLIGNAGQGSGSIYADTTLGTVIVKGDLRGGGGSESGVIHGGLTAAITIGDDVVAGTGSGSGTITSLTNLGAVKIGGDLDATATPAGVAGASSGGIQAAGKIASVTILGSLKGGATTQSGFIESGSDLGAVIVQNIVGGSALHAGSILAGGKIASLTVNGDITGGSAFGAGSVFSGNNPDQLGDIGAIKIAGQVVGGSETSTGTIASGGRIASVTIGPVLPGVNTPRLTGGDGDFSGAIFSQGAIGAVQIFGHIEGGAGDFSGAVVARDAITPSSERAGDLGLVTIRGHVLGGAGDDSGQISADGKLTGVTIGEHLAGAGGDRSGNVRAAQGAVNLGATGAISIKGALTGGAGALSGGIITEAGLLSVTVNGEVNGATIRAGDDIGAVTFSLSVLDTIVSARGKAAPTATSDLALGKITVGGDVIGSSFLAGYTTDLVASNPDAQIGAVLVKGNWTASSIAAGVTASPTGFGAPEDAVIPGGSSATIVSLIASIVITGNVVSGDPGVHHGFVAEKIGAFKAAGVAQLLSSTIAGQVFEIIPGEVTVREVTA